MGENDVNVLAAKHDALADKLSSEIAHIGRLIDEKMCDVERKIDINNAVSMRQQSEIIEQAKRTNGRVGYLELWRSWMLGALAALALGVPFLSAVIINWAVAR